MSIMAQAPFALRRHNPDVLTCIANLSNDEVFTPPEMANAMLDLLAASWADAHNGASIWADPTVTFLDPFTKSGVFLREITRRLVDGLASQFPDLQERVDHILTQQVYGIGITRLTALLARRSVYCSKFANGPHSIAKSFTSEDGNIWFQRTEHTWVGGQREYRIDPLTGEKVAVHTHRKCKYCGASEDDYGRGDELETHAYAFIHAADIKARIGELFGANMQFDVIIGNPPYQLSDGGGEGDSAIPLYHRFVEQAKKLDPRELVMIIPARWYSGGKGLDDFRAAMLTDGHLAEIHDFAETDLVFPGVNIRGGVCYFRWSPDHTGPARVVNYSKCARPVEMSRFLCMPGISTFVRYNDAVSILDKVRAKNEPTMDSRVQPRNLFGIPSNFLDFSTTKTSETPVLLFRSRRGSSANKTVYVSADKIRSNAALKDRLKVLVSKASPGGDEYPHAIFSQPIIAPENSVATETYLIVDFPTNETEAQNLITYMKTRFFRFLVSLIKTTQNISRRSFSFVPIQDLSHSWTDENLYAKYRITATEIAFVERMIRPMNRTDDRTATDNLENDADA